MNTIQILVVLLHGCTCDPHMIFARFASTERCAEFSEAVGQALRTEYRDAVTYCHATGAPVNSPLPMRRPVREAAK